VTVRKAIVAISVVGAGALAIVTLVILSGAPNIKASSRHWPITSWILDFTKRRSVATHATATTVPNLDDFSLIRKGAAHYELGCRTCHGSPKSPRPTIPMGMTPHPADLPKLVGRWKPEELFYIVKHGIKFTGMPAWPAATRDDEVWAVVAFLRRLPGLTAEDYQRLAFGSAPLATATTAPPMVAACAQCHGVDGQGGPDAAFPRLAGQRPEYLRLSLLAYAKGTRASGIMQPIAAELAEDAINRIAEYYSLSPASAPFPRVDGAGRGEEIAQRGIPRQDVPACVQCHAAQPETRNPAYPSLAAQTPAHLALQLRLFKENRRGGSAYEHIMKSVASRLTPEQMADVAAYFASIPKAR
jgi:cytochrome c553